MRVADPPLHKELVRLGDSRYLAALHRLPEFLERLLADQLAPATLVDPAREHLLHAPLLVGGEPSLALAPAVASSDLAASPRVEYSSLFRSPSILTRWNRWV